METRRSRAQETEATKWGDVVWRTKLSSFRAVFPSTCQCTKSPHFRVITVQGDTQNSSREDNCRRRSNGLCCGYYYHGRDGISSFDEKLNTPWWFLSQVSLLCMPRLALFSGTQPLIINHTDLQACVSGASVSYKCQQNRLMPYNVQYVWDRSRFLGRLSSPGLVLRFGLGYRVSPRGGVHVVLIVEGRAPKITCDSLSSHVRFHIWFKLCSTNMLWKDHYRKVWKDLLVL